MVFVLQEWEKERLIIWQNGYVTKERLILKLSPKLFCVICGDNMMANLRLNCLCRVSMVQHGFTYFFIMQ